MSKVCPKQFKHASEKSTSYVKSSVSSRWKGSKPKSRLSRDQMPGHHSSTESAEEAAEKAPCLSTDAAHAATSANVQSVPTSDAAEPMCLGQAAPCHEASIPGKGRLAWTEWLGKRVGISGYDDLHQLYCEWVDGIETTTGRIAPLRELERLKRQEGLEWRCSGKIRKQVMERKVLIYAVLRRLPDPAKEYGSEDKAVHDAIRELEDLRRTVAESQNSQSNNKKKKKLTLSQLQEYLSHEVAKTKKDGMKQDGNSAFEEDVFGWAQPKCMANGNPKQQS